MKTTLSQNPISSQESSKLKRHRLPHPARPAHYDVPISPPPHLRPVPTNRFASAVGT
ncbi:hypothetical protein BJ508DRAFT_417220 [Ascobolus immersus RN42]|uniref:Uncharacterized protein n=1 Tax=Ascobolus immersus RN42 TaxID=1160509 RepID=A0A3N4HZ56_ASCIM|nr:hypothetical protein BJ508DRAFT_417220 [Ascobolus immersus RN42]